jgi:hypothetical protein
LERQQGGGFFSEALGVIELLGLFGFVELLGLVGLLGFVGLLGSGRFVRFGGFGWFLELGIQVFDKLNKPNKPLQSNMFSD